MACRLTTAGDTPGSGDDDDENDIFMSDNLLDGNDLATLDVDFDDDEGRSHVVTPVARL